ncbi:MAG: hypothetical protein OXM58_16485 [Rhodospirillaceae bacterium]|nr:hypothetical protein [Rhodospirillaceae bacterium]MDE0619967.1 hypothetical protein [Rhodospirillaceae bacterium]
MANETLVKQLDEVCEAIAALIPKRKTYIERPQKWGEISFEIIERDIDNVFWLAQEITNLPTNILPDNIVQSTTSHLTNANAIFSEIEGFTISQGDPVSLRDQIAGRFMGEVQNAMSSIGIWLPVLALRAGEMENWAAKMKNTSAEATKILQDTNEYASEQKDEIKKIAEAARIAAGEAGAAEFTVQFDREAAIFEARSKRWLWPTAIFSALALVLSVALVFGFLGKIPENVWEAAYGLGGRVIAISVLFYAAVWSGRIVLANMHLASVNKHRAVSIQTLQAFHKTAEDAAAKDAVVLEAARAVYENVPSGYIGRQATEGGAGGRTLELIRNARSVRTSDAE